MSKKTTNTKYRYPRVRWGSNLAEIGFDDSFSSEVTFYKAVTLCTNPAQSNTMVNNQYTIKNVELQFTLVSDAPSNFEKLVGYIMYVPQGFEPTINYPTQHPEYIMAYRYFGDPSPFADTSRYPITVKTRLARRLQTGDSIIFLVKGAHMTTASNGLHVQGICKWNSKAN